MCNCGKKTQPSNYVDQSVYNNVDAMKRSGISNQVVVREATQGNEFLDAIYNGPSTPHYIPSTTGVITSYGIKNYGMGKKGDRIRVHVNDINSVNGKRLYTVIQGEEEMPESNEFLYAGNVSAEARSNQRLKEQAEKRSKSEARKATRAAKADEKETVAQEDADAKAEQELAESQNDLVALTKRSGEAVNKQVAEGGQPQAEGANTPPTQRGTTTTDTAGATTNTATGNPSGATSNSNAAAATGNTTGGTGTNNDSTSGSGKTAKSGR